MKLASLKSSHRDGELFVVSKDGKKMAPASSIAHNLRSAVEDWATSKPLLQSLYEDLNAGKAPDTRAVNEEELLSPLPRAFQWIDGSAFIQHIKLVRKSRSAPLPETLYTTPLAYQGAGDSFLAPREDIPLIDNAYGLDFEAEIGVIVDDVPLGISPEGALNHIILIVLINDISLRGLALAELRGGFGFLQSKPSSSFAPFAVSADELGDPWCEGRIHLPLLVDFNGKSFGRANGGEMYFHFGRLISHCAQTRKLSAGTIIGSGTVSNEDSSKGSSCLVEKRTLEKIETGSAKQEFMRDGDQVEIKMLDEEGRNIFGSIIQKAKAVK